MRVVRVVEGSRIGLFTPPLNPPSPPSTPSPGFSALDDPFFVSRLLSRMSRLRLTPYGL